MLGIGIVGIGFMGAAHYRAALGLAGARVTALATRDRRKWAGDWTAIRGNYGAGGGRQDLADVHKHATLEDLLRDPAVDLVDLCLPTDLHRVAAVAALEAGKHVLVEKPIALTAADARAMRDAAEANGGRLFVAHVVRFMPAYVALRQLVADGRCGAVVALTLKRVVSAAWRDDGWPRSVARSGGPVIDLLVHDADLAQLLFGVPRRVMASAHRRDGQAVHYHAQLLYDDGPSVLLTGGVTGMPGRPFEQGFELHLERGLLQFDSVLRSPPLLLTPGAAPEELAVPPADPLKSQLQYVVDALHGAHDGALLGAASAARSLAICLAVRESIRSGELVEVGGEREGRSVSEVPDPHGGEPRELV